MLLRGSNVELAAGASATWRDATRTVELEHGSITVEVTPGKGQHFRVATPTFIVEVVGTRFTVTEASVTTEHGKVRVLSTDEKLLATVGAGESWHVPVEPLRPLQKETSSVPPKTPTIAPTTAPIESRSTRGSSPRKVAARPADPLGDARRALTHGDADAARAILVSLLHGARKTAVEARALMAESYLVEGRYGDAMESYRTVVRDFDGTPQAESALYAIAELEVEHSSMDEAARALRRYLAKHPQGRFTKEAHDRLDRLGTRNNK